MIYHSEQRRWQVAKLPRSTNLPLLPLSLYWPPLSKSLSHCYLKISLPHASHMPHCLRIGLYICEVSRLAQSSRIPGQQKKNRRRRLRSRSGPLGGSGAVGRVKEGERIGFNRELGRRGGQTNEHNKMGKKWTRWRRKKNKKANYFVLGRRGTRGTRGNMGARALSRFQTHRPIQWKHAEGAIN